MATKYAAMTTPDIGDGGNGLDASVSGERTAEVHLEKMRVAGAAVETRLDALEGSPPFPLGSSVFGDGSDGDRTLDGSTTILGMAPSSSVYTAARDLYFDDLTINAGVTLFMNGFKLHVAGTCTTVDATSIIHNNGKAAVADAAGAVTNTAASTGVGTAGGAGRAGSSGVGVAGGNHAIGFPGHTGVGGAGGGDGTNVGGAGGTFTALAAAKGGARNLFNLLMGLVFGTQTSGTAALMSLFGGGSGGGGGATDHTDGTAGGGGGAAGVLIGAINNLVGAGKFQANGGAGADGTSAAHNAGGGGGGMGGVVILVTRTNDGAYTAEATGGLGGAKAGASGVAGTAGSDGVVIEARA